MNTTIPRMPGVGVGRGLGDAMSFDGDRCVDMPGMLSDRIVSVVGFAACRRY